MASVADPIPWGLNGEVTSAAWTLDKYLERLGLNWWRLPEAHLNSSK